MNRTRPRKTVHQEPEIVSGAGADVFSSHGPVSRSWVCRLPSDPLSSTSVLPLVVGAFCILISAIVLAGWQFRTEWLISIPGHQIAMAPNAAFLFMLAGLSLVLLRSRQHPRVLVLAGKVMAGCITGFGAVTLAEYLLHLNLGIDTVFFRHRILDWAAPTVPGRFSFQADLAFTLAGLSLLLLDRRIRGIAISELAAAGVGLISFLSLLGYAYGIAPLHGVMALETTVVFFFLSTGLIFMRPGVGAAALLVSKGTGGIAARYLLVTVVGVLILFGWLECRFEAAGLVESRFGTALMVAGSGIVVSLLILWTAKKLETVDRALRRDEAILAQAGQMARLGAWDIEISNRKQLNANPLRWSDEVYRIFGYDPGEVQVSNDLFLERVHPEDRMSIADALAAAVADKKPYEIVHRIVRADGVERVVLEHAELIFDHQGQLTSIVGAVQDITERKQAEEALIRSEKLASVGRMAATIAHEINNPLEAVMNAIYLARQDPTLSGQGQEELAIADEELRRVAHITRQTLGFYREHAKPAEVSLPELLDSVIDLFAHRFRNKRIRLQKRYSASTPLIYAVAGEIRQIASNLLANSIDAVGDGGVIYVRVSPYTMNGSISVRVTVADTGSGIPVEDRKRIFDAFYTTKEAVGTGLGLWVTKEIIEKHRGSIHVRSKVGSGTVFSVCFPMPGSNSAVPPVEFKRASAS